MSLTRIFSQNLIPNHSFEDNDISHPNSPDGPEQIEHMQKWKNFKTSDWYSDQIGRYIGFYDPTNSTYGGAPNANKMYAHTGNRFIGLGSCEGAQVKLTDKTEKMHWITVSFWFSPRGNCNTKINAYLLKNQAGTNALDNCWSPNISYEVHYQMDVKAMPGPDQKYIPGNWYFYQSEPQLATEEQYEWFVIKGDNVAGAFTDNNYIYVDDVSLTQIDFCDHICTNSGGDVQYTLPYRISTGMIGNSGLNFFATFKNANKLEFRVFNRLGCMIYESINYDPNGLVDPGYNDFAIVWNGNTNTHGAFNCNINLGDALWQTVYSIKIDAESCIGEDYHYIGDITIGEIYNPPAVPYPSTKKREAPDCCPDHKYYQNKDFYSIDRTDVDNFITAGHNVTSGALGNVTVRSGAEVKFFAGNSINLLPGFSVEPGGNFSAVIEACAVAPRQNSSDSLRNHYENLRSVADFNLLVSYAKIKIFPNPSTGFFTISGMPKGETEFENKIIITDVFGKIIKKTETTDESVIVNLSNLNKGIYIVKIENSKGIVQVEKVVIQ